MLLDVCWQFSVDAADRHIFDKIHYNTRMGGSGGAHTLILYLTFLHHFHLEVMFDCELTRIFAPFGLCTKQYVYGAAMFTVSVPTV